MLGYIDDNKKAFPDLVQVHRRQEPLREKARTHCRSGLEQHQLQRDLCLDTSQGRQSHVKLVPGLSGEEGDARENWSQVVWPPKWSNLSSPVLLPLGLTGWF